MASMSAASGASAGASSAGSAAQPTPGSVVSLAVSLIDDVPAGRYNPLLVPSAQKVLCHKKSVLDRSITYSSLPSSYSSNSQKESTLLEYVEDFRRQFVQVFPTRRPLTLCPRNECGVRKFLPSTIHPSLLPYSDAYDLKDLAEFVADFLEYIPLDDPTRLPDGLVAATDTMLRVRKGDCVDHAIMLVSLLRGAGFNAYVVLGYAPQWVTEKDQSDVVCPLLPDQAEVARKEAEDTARKAEEAKKYNKYAILQKPAHTSRYRAARLQEAADIAAKAVADEEARIRKLHERAADPLHGQRAHAWVLVSRGRRDITEEVFVEATTGVVYPVAKSPYLAVDALFNEHNYWVNVQTTLDGNMLPIPQMLWDLNNGHAWEYVLIDEQRYRNSMMQRAQQAAGGMGGMGGGGAGGGAVGGGGGVSSFESVNEEGGGADSTNAASSGAGVGGVSNAGGAGGVLSPSPSSGASSGSVLSMLGSRRPLALSSSSSALAPEDSFDDRAILDTPASWTLRIHIGREDFVARYPGGFKHTQFRDCVVEQWSPYKPGQVGRIRRVNVFQPREWTEEAEAASAASAAENGGRVSPPALIEVWESFAHRKDKLVERRRYPLEGRVVASYAPGLLTGLQSYTCVELDPSASASSTEGGGGGKKVGPGGPGGVGPRTNRSFTFYPGARVDGLVGREETHQSKVVETYQGRDDRLIYRSIAVDHSGGRALGARSGGAAAGGGGPGAGAGTGGGGGQKVVFLPLGPRCIEFPIRKLTEKYARNPSIPAEADVSKRTHFLTQNSIRLDFHLGDHHITHSVHLLDKADKLEQAETEGRQVGSVGSLLRVDPHWQERSRGEEQQMVAKLLLIEKELKLKLKAREESWIKEVVKLDEELDDRAGKILLEKSIYDVAYEEARAAELAGTAGMDGLSPGGSGGAGGNGSLSDSDASRQSDANRVDYLSPFLSQYPSIATKPLTRRQAQQVKDECLAALKERLLERAHIIQQHLDEETSKLHQRQSLFKRQAGSGAVEASEEFNKFSNQCLFRIDILNARRARHEELALKKYVEMDERLNNDPRLAALHQQE